jgi:hypothetical protein
MTDVVRLSQRKSSGEEDDQGVQGHFPAARAGSGFTSSLAGDVPQSEIQQLHGRFVGREVPASLGHLTKLEVDGFNGVRRVHHPTKFDRIVEERDELVPGTLPNAREMSGFGLCPGLLVGGYVE